VKLALVFLSDEGKNSRIAHVERVCCEGNAAQGDSGYIIGDLKQIPSRSFTNEFAMKPPKRYKTALLIWIAIYPSINILFLLIGDWLMTIPLLLRTLVLTGILVPLMVFVLLPFLSKVFVKWLNR
jgi:hypothetical protein